MEAQAVVEEADPMTDRPKERVARELKPCPFCGEEPILVGGTSWGLYGIECTCPASPSVTETDADEAIAAWNRRAHPDSEVREALEERVHDALKAYRAWNEVTGVPDPHSSWNMELESVIEDAVKIGAGRYEELDKEIRRLLQEGGGP